MHVSRQNPLLALFACVLLNAGCGTKEETPPVRIVALDRAFEAPRGVAAGLRHIVFENRGHDLSRVVWLRRHFAPGRHVLLCQMPVANSDLKHDDMGMVREIEIAE